jgi:hypothetical protein
VYFVIDSVRKLSDTTSYVLHCHILWAGPAFCWSRMSASASFVFSANRPLFAIVGSQDPRSITSCDTKSRAVLLFFCCMRRSYFQIPNCLASAVMMCHALLIINYIIGS